MTRWTMARETEPVRTWMPSQAPWIGRMSWENVLFLHWPVDPERLAPHIPAGVSLDLAQGKAWVSVTALTMRRVGARLVPPMPAFAELNVRTYVTADGKPGVLFLELHAPNPLVTTGGKALGLPYRLGRTVMRQDGKSYRFASRAGQASMAVSYTPGDGSVDDGLHRFLTARYCLYTPQGRWWRIDFRHAPWVLHPVEVLMTSQGLQRFGVEGEPEIAAFSPGVDAVMAPPTAVEGPRRLHAR